MNNLKSFNDYFEANNNIFLGETIFIDEQPDNFFEGVLQEAKKFIDQKELADEVKKSLEEGEIVYIKLMGKPNRPVRTVTHKLAKLLVELINSIAYGEYRRRWSNLSDEQFDEVIAITLKDVLQDWDRSVDKPNLTDGQIYGNLRTLIKTRLLGANNQVMRKVTQEPSGKSQVDYDAIDRTISKILTGTTDRPYRPAVKAPAPGEKSWFDEISSMED
jgi:hypothetical protein